MTKNVIKRIFLILLPVSILWIAIVAYNLKVESRFVVMNLIHANELKDSNTGFLVDKYIEEIIENLKLVRDSNELNEYIINPNIDTNYELVDMFKRVISNKEDYDQIRLINAEGLEIARVDNDESISEIAGSELQDKSDRYYFQQTKTLPFGEVFISPLDLNEENGIVELPFKPMVRFATPIYSEENEFVGILIINYKAEYFVRLLEEHESHTGIDNFWFYIVNKNGEFILNKEDDSNFSFMFKETEDMNFDKVSHKYWEIIENSDKGSIENNKELVTYHDILAETKEEHTNYEEKWIAIHEMDISSLFSVKAVAKAIVSPKNLLNYLLILLFIVFFSLVFEKLKKRNNQLLITEKIASSTNDGVLITDANTNITYANAAYEDITGYKIDEVIGMQPRDFKSGKQDKSFYKKMWESINEDGFWEGMLWDKKKSGVLYPLKLRIIAVKNKNKVHHYISIMTIMALNRQNIEKNEELDYKENDFLVPNEDLMLQLLQQSVRDKSFNFMVLYISIENYNQLVTTFENFENRSSELFMELIKPLIRDDDFIAQTGRNIFAVIISMKDIKGSPQEFVNKIHKRLSKVVSINGRDLFFKTRIGVSFWPQDTNDLKRLLLNSIIALDWTTSRQAADIAYFSENMIYELNQENEIEGYLRNAIKKDELSMVYQPQVDLTSNKVIGIEALIRWNNDKLGMISPAEFIPVAERTNIIIDIGYGLLIGYVVILADIREQYPDLLKDIRCAINISAVQMQEGEFLERLYAIVDNNNTNKGDLEIEITESLLLRNEVGNIEILKDLRQAGFTIAIDDFGTGYSSLSYLNTLPIDKIKIDRSFIKDYPETDDGKLARVLVSLAESLDLDVLVEGAETEEQISFLNEIGCRYLQGYYFSKPLAKKDLAEFLYKNELLNQKKNQKD